MSASPASLSRALLRPRSIAILGASDDPRKPTSRPLRFLQRAGFSGRIYPVNPNRTQIGGIPCYPSLSDLPEVPDQVFILTGGDTVLAAVQVCVQMEVGAVSVLAGGFGEDGEAGLARRGSLQGLLAGSKTRLLGPNSIGIVNLHAGLVLTANAAFEETGLRPGGVFVASHSGSMIGAILSRGIAAGRGFSGFVSTGSEVDLTLGEICSATLDDDQVTSYALFLESIQNGAALRKFAEGAAERGKPVVAYKLGRSTQAAELSRSHTGAIAGEDGVADAFLRGLGFARVETFDALIEAPLLAETIRRQSRSGAGGTRLAASRVGVVSTTGGGAALIVDQLGIRGVSVERPSPETVRKLREEGIEPGEARIVDLTLAGTRREVMQRALEIMCSSGEYGLVIAVAGSSARFNPEVLVDAIRDASESGCVPIAAFLAPDAPESMKRLGEAGVASFRTPESCADAVAALSCVRPGKFPACVPSGFEGSAISVNEIEGYRLVTALGIPAARHAIISSDAAESPIPYPVALKLLAASVRHKTDIGGVILNIKSNADLKAALSQMRAALAANGVASDTTAFMVQEMRRGVGEVLLSVSADSDAGRIVMVAAGGIFADIYKDASMRLAPVTKEEALAMIAEVKGLAAISGFRGRTAGDIDALAEAIVAVSKVPEHVREIEINPLIVAPTGEGVVAVDAVVSVEEAHHA